MSSTGATCTVLCWGRDTTGWRAQLLCPAAVPCADLYRHVADAQHTAQQVPFGALGCASLATVAKCLCVVLLCCIAALLAATGSADNLGPLRNG